MVFLIIFILTITTVYADDLLDKDKLFEYTLNQAKKELENKNSNNIFFNYRVKKLKKMNIRPIASIKKSEWNDLEKSLDVMDKKIKSITKKLNLDLDGEWGKIKLKTNKTIDTINLYYKYEF